MNLTITTRNARFQEWQALLGNRRKRQRSGEFIAHGVRPVTLAVRHGWPIRALIYPDGRPLSAWAESILAEARPGQRAGVLAWVRARHRAGVPVTVLGTDEKADVDVADHDLTGPTLIVVGNEMSGLSEAWRTACDRIARIPITGSASSLNAASAATVLLYEAARQRHAARGPGPESSPGA